MFMEITRREFVQRQRIARWGEPELAAFKAECQRYAEIIHDDDYFANLFTAIKDMSIEDIITEYDKWGDESNECIMIKDGPRIVPLGAIINEELTKAVMKAKVSEDSIGGFNDEIRCYRQLYG